VRHAAIVEVFRYSDGTACAFTGVLIADASWGAGEVWKNVVQQSLTDPETGFAGLGPSVVVGYAGNFPVTVQCGVMLADASYLASTGDITANIQKALQSYFDDRPDWYTFTTAGLRAAIVKSDARIRACASNPVLVDGYDGTAVPAPARVDRPQPPPYPGGPSQFGSGIFHYLLIASGVQITFVGPS
jgi:hypothetical protein